MKVDFLHLPETKDLITLIRVLLDIFILLIARRSWLKHQLSLEETFSTRRIPLDEYRTWVLKNIPPGDISCYGSPIGVIASRPCRITILRVKILLSNSQEQFAAGAYIDIQGEGDFQSIHLSLPMVISEETIASEGILHAQNDDHNSIVLTDQREEGQRTGSFIFRTYRTVAIPFIQTGASVTVSIPVSCGPFTSGLPMTEARELTVPLKNIDSSVTLYLPAVEKMELILDMPPKSFAFDPFGQAPSPEYFSYRECRWISGTSPGFRPHSSITSRLIYGVGEDRLQLSRIRDGIVLGIWTAVFVTVTIDLVWILVELLREIAH